MVTAWPPHGAIGRGAALAKAMAVVETWWDQQAVGAPGEVGIL
jgi:hypothetical protein